MKSYVVPLVSEGHLQAKTRKHSTENNGKASKQRIVAAITSLFASNLVEKSLFFDQSQTLRDIQLGPDIDSVQNWDILEGFFRITDFKSTNKKFKNALYSNFCGKKNLLRNHDTETKLSRFARSVRVKHVLKNFVPAIKIKFLIHFNLFKIKMNWGDRSQSRVFKHIEIFEIPTKSSIFKYFSQKNRRRKCYTRTKV